LSSPTTGIFDEGRYFDVFIEYAKANSEEILIRITAWNRGPDGAKLHLLPTICFATPGPGTSTTAATSCPSWTRRRHARSADDAGLSSRIRRTLVVRRRLPADGIYGNESDLRRLFGSPNAGFNQKNGISDFVTKGQRYRLNAEQFGTKAAVYYLLDIPAGESAR